MKKIGLMVFILTIMTAGFMMWNIPSAPAQDQPAPYTNVASTLRSPAGQAYPTPAPHTEGSLFNDQGAFLYRDNKAYGVGDVVSIQIVETSKASKSADTDLGRDSSIQAGLGGMLGYETTFGLPASYNPSSAVDLSYNNSYKGTGKTTRNDSITAQISARVIQVLPGGNMVIRGSREITVNYEKQYMIIEGVIRSADISTQNTIQSTQIADARIVYKGKGDLSRQQRKAWGSRLLDVLWPF